MLACLFAWSLRRRGQLIPGIWGLAGHGYLFGSTFGNDNSDNRWSVWMRTGWLDLRSFHTHTYTFWFGHTFTGTQVTSTTTTIFEFESDEIRFGYSLYSILPFSPSHSLPSTHRSPPSSTPPCLPAWFSTHTTCTPCHLPFPLFYLHCLRSHIRSPTYHSSSLPFPSCLPTHLPHLPHTHTFFLVLVFHFSGWFLYTFCAGFLLFLISSSLHILAGREVRPSHLL